MPVIGYQIRINLNPRNF